MKVAERDDSEDFGHIAMTYSALVVLTSLGADLSALPKAALLRVRTARPWKALEEKGRDQAPEQQR